MNWNGQMGNGTITPTGPQALTPVMVSNSQPGQVVNNPEQVFLRLYLWLGSADERHGVDLGHWLAW